MPRHHKAARESRGFEAPRVQDGASRKFQFKRDSPPPANYRYSISPALLSFFFHLAPRFAGKIKIPSVFEVGINKLDVFFFFLQNKFTGSWNFVRTRVGIGLMPEIPAHSWTLRNPGASSVYRKMLTARGMEDLIVSDENERKFAEMLSSL